jgi:hypothetical protein
MSLNILPVHHTPGSPGEETGRSFAAWADQEALVNPNQALWENGDFTQFAGMMRESGEAGGASARGVGVWGDVRSEAV